jgi:hypothetical protein
MQIKLKLEKCANVTKKVFYAYLKSIVKVAKDFLGKG